MGPAHHPRMRSALAAALLSLALAPAQGQPVGLRWEPARPVAGETFTLAVTVETSAALASQARLEALDLSRLEAVAVPSADEPEAVPLADEGRVRLEWRYRVQAARGGVLALPAPAVSLWDPVAARVRRLVGEPVRIEVLEPWQVAEAEDQIAPPAAARAARSALLETADPPAGAAPPAPPAADIRDIKEAWPIPPPPLAVWIAAALLLMLALALAGRWLVRRRQSTEEPVIVVPEEPAHLWALRELEALRRTDWLERREIDAFVVRLTEILKTYLELRWSFAATRYTSSEILETLHRRELPGRWLNEMGDILAHCDLEKFAGFLFPAEAARALLERSDRMVRETAACALLAGGEAPMAAEATN